MPTQQQDQVVVASQYQALIARCAQLEILYLGAVQQCKGYQRLFEESILHGDTTQWFGLSHYMLQDTDFIPADVASEVMPRLSNISSGDIAKAELAFRNVMGDSWQGKPAPRRSRSRSSASSTSASASTTPSTPTTASSSGSGTSTGGGSTRRRGATPAQLAGLERARAARSRNSRQQGSSGSVTTPGGATALADTH